MDRPRDGPGDEYREDDSDESAAYHRDDGEDLEEGALACALDRERVDFGGVDFEEAGELLLHFQLSVACGYEGLLVHLAAELGGLHGDGVDGVEVGDGRTRSGGNLIPVELACGVGIAGACELLAAPDILVK
ncbi:MAG: hypothetical protein BWX86_02458 [Verrucomicrobia bacterium ADurb.Bin122]|nr:MAG: hypothetical protein BWX86_02458 [Verrucomicrobia bacterium ADurb.Bin122]